MTKNVRNGLLLTIFCLIVFALSSYDLFGEKKLPVPLTVPFMLLGIVGTFMGPAFMLFHIPLERRTKIARLSIRLSAFLMLFAIISGYNHIPGAGWEIIIGVMIFCFFYGTLSLKNKYDKWKVYARSKYDALFLSLFDFVGVGALALAFLFRQMHWPMAEEMGITGFVIIVIGIIAWNRKFKKEVVYRKETEDKLKKTLEQIEAQHKSLEEKQKEIIDSIKYAKRIQGSQLPTEKYIEKSLNRLKNN